MQQLAQNQDIEAFLRPISDGEPAGAYLGNSRLYDEIREARRSDDPSQPQGVWERELRTAHWDQVEALCTQALREKSKDLNLAVWLMEAWVHTRGVPGIRDGITLVSALSREFWDTVYPDLSRGDEFRVSPFDWINEKMDEALGVVALARPVLHPESAPTWNNWKRALWLEQLRSRRPGDKSVQEEVETSLSREAIDARVAATPVAFYDEAVDALEQAVQTTRDLSDFLDERLDPDATSLSRFRGVLEEMLQWMRSASRLAQPAPAEAVAESTEEAVDVSVETEAVAVEEAAVDVPSGESAPSSSGPITSRKEAYRRLLEAARYLKQIEPHSPAPYLVMRAVAWGDKSLDELLKEFVSQGLNIEALFTFLGIDREE